MSHSARSHSSCLDVPESKLATSQVAGTRWSSYGTTATLRRSAQFNQHQGLKLHPCLRRLVHHQDTRETQFGNQPVRVSVRSKDTPSSCPSGSSFASEDHRQLAERCIRLAKECTKPSVAEYLMTLAANYLELAERALRLYEPATAARRQHIKVMQKE